MASRFIEISQCKDYAKAIAFQKEIVAFISDKKRNGKISVICGLDVSFDKSSDKIYAAAAVYSYPNLIFLEEKAIQAIAQFPYIPGLLAFREGPVVLELVDRLKNRPDCLLFDGHGLAHPRRCGIASLVGLLLDIPSIGCAKTKLVGDHDQPEESRGSTSDLIFKGVVVGKVLRTKANPVFVLVGHKLCFDKAVEIVLNCCPKYRIPEPIRKAHILANQIRRGDR